MILIIYKTQPKEQVISAIESKMEDESFGLNSDEAEDEMIKNTLSAKAHYILRRLNSTGRFEIEI